ncbi:MAG: diguanylate cyclase [Phycisphaerales bacterium JB063]
MKPLPENLRHLLHHDTAPPRIILVDPDTPNRSAIADVLKAHFDGTTITQTFCMDELLREDLDAVDLMICAIELPDASAFDVVEEVLLLRPEMPIVVIVDENQRDDAAMAVHQGAYDFVVRAPGYERLMPVVVEKNLAVSRVKQDNGRLQAQLTSTLAQLKSRNEQLQSLVLELETIAATDALTGIANRRALTESLERRHAQSVRDGNDMAVLMIDMDGFKALNDTAGHAAGDRILRLTARVLKANCRASDVAGRIGGDEFVVVLPSTEIDEARAVAERIREDFAAASISLCDTLGYEGRVTMSVGMATRAIDPGATADQLLGLADKALYSAKQLGKHRLVIHDPGSTLDPDGSGI